MIPFLRDMKEEDLEFVLTWRNQRYVRDVMLNDHKISWQEHKDWYSKHLYSERSILKVFMLDEQPVGIVSFSNIDYLNGTCEWGFYLGESNLPKGTGTVLCSSALDFIFKEIKLRKVCASVLESNTGSYFLHKKLGFREEGRLIKQIFRDEEYIDVFLFGILEEEWQRN